MAFTFVQKAQNTLNTASPATLAYGSNNTLGNLLVCVGRGNLFAAGTTVTDSQGNTWVKPVDNNYATVNNFFMAYALNCKAGANTVTVTQTGGLLTYTIAEYSGVLSFDTSTSLASNTTTPSSGNITTAVANELLLGGIFDIGSGVTAGTGYTERTTGAATRAYLEDKFTNTAGTNAATYSHAALATCMGIMAFKPIISAVPNSLMMLGCGT